MKKVLIGIFSLIMVLSLNHPAACQNDQHSLDVQLIRAAMDGKQVDVLYWLGKGANVDGTLADGKTALIWAASNGHIEVVKVLLNWRPGANVNAADHLGFTALMAAVLGYDKEKTLEVVKLLLAAGANVDAKNVKGWTALKLATDAGNTEVVMLLQQHGAH